MRSTVVSFVFQKPSPLPPAAPLMTVEPLDHSVLYTKQGSAPGPLAPLPRPGLGAHTDWDSHSRTLAKHGRGSLGRGAGAPALVSLPLGASYSHPAAFLCLNLGPSVPLSRCLSLSLLFSSQSHLDALLHAHPTPPGRDAIKHKVIAQNRRKEQQPAGLSEEERQQKADDVNKQINAEIEVRRQQGARSARQVCGSRRGRAPYANAGNTLRTRSSAAAPRMACATPVLRAPLWCLLAPCATTAAAAYKCNSKPVITTCRRRRRRCPPRCVLARCS